MSLTQLQITNAKPAVKPYKLVDGGALYLLIEPTGAKKWRMNYRHCGRQRTLHIGALPEVSLADARRARESARRKLAAGLDPVGEAQREKREAVLATACTFRVVAEEWYEKNVREGLATVTLGKIRWLLKMAWPALSHRPITEITAFEVLTVLRKLEATGRYESARRMRSVLSRIFRYAIATARAERDVAADLRGAIITPQVTHFAAITTPEGVGRLLRSIDRFEGHETTAYALKLAPHLFVRPGELRAAEWGEFDADAAIWNIPADKTKMRRAHRVSLSRQVKEILFDLYELTGHGRFLFPSALSPERPLSENTLNAALRRLGYGKDEMTSHGFRAMAATLLNEMGIWHPDVIERQLAHLDKNAVRRAYTRGEHWDERVRMMQRWSDYLDELRLTQPKTRTGFDRRAADEAQTARPSGFSRPSAAPA